MKGVGDMNKLMNKLMVVMTVLCVLSFGLVTGSQARSMGQKGLAIYDTSKLIGLTVKSPDGVTLGQIFDLVIDSRAMWILPSLANRVLKNFPAGSWRFPSIR